MRSNLSFFRCNFRNWVVWLISDNFSSNPKILLGTSKLLVGFLSHKRNLHVNKMICVIRNLHKQIGTVHKTMSTAKTIKIAAILQKLTVLAPVLPNATRWCKKSQVLNCLVHIKNNLLLAGEDLDAFILVQRSAQFMTKVENLRP